MNFDIVRNALRNIRHKKARSILTISAVAIGAAAIVIIGNIGQCGAEVLGDELDSMGMDGFTIAADTENSAAAKLSDTELSLVKEASSIQDASPVMVYNSNVSMRNLEEETLLWGVDETADEIVSIEILYGRMLSRYDIKSENSVCLIDESIAQAAYHRGNVVGKEIIINCVGTQQRFEIIGVVKTGGGLLQNLIGNYVPSFVYIPISTLQSIVQRDDFDRIAAKAIDQEDPEKIGEKISQILDRENQTNDGYTITNLSNQRDQLMDLLDVVTLILTVIGSISLLVSGLGIMTVMLVSVSERTKEIGIKKSIGAKRGRILQEFLTEALLITAFGSILGIIFGSGVTWIGAFLLQIRFQPNAAMIVGTFIISILIGVVFGVYPASKASKLDPAVALRES